MVAVAVLLGFALVGAGPRACAGFIPAGSGAAALAGAGDSAPVDDQVWPPQAPKPQELALPTAFAPRDTGGAGSSSTAPTSSVGQAGLTVVSVVSDLPPPPLVARLRSAHVPLPSSPRLAGIFEPPRGS